MSASGYFQHTVAGPVIFAGIGLHTGEHVRVVVRPSAADAGIVFVRTDVQDRDNRVPVSAEAVCQTQLGTVIGNAAGVRVSTIEHLMAALAALSIDNGVVELDGPEVPIMDGSSEPFVQILDRAGRRKQEAVRQYIEILAPITVEEGDKQMRVVAVDAHTMAQPRATCHAPLGQYCPAASRHP